MNTDDDSPRAERFTTSWMVAVEGREVELLSRTMTEELEAMKSIQTYQLFPFVNEIGLEVTFETRLPARSIPR